MTWVLGICAGLWLWYLGSALIVARDSAAWEATGDLLIRMLPILLVSFVAWWAMPPMARLVGPLAPAAACVVLLLAWVEFLMDGGRSEILTGNQLLLAAAVIPLAFLSLEHALCSTGWHRIWGYTGFLAAGLSISALAASRGVFAALLIGLVAGFVTDLIRRHMDRTRVTQYAVAGVLAALVLVCSVNWGPGRYQYRVFYPYLGIDVAGMMAAHASDTTQNRPEILEPFAALTRESSPKVRLRLWRISAETGARAPVLGNGAIAISQIMAEMTATQDPDQKQIVYSYNHLHNAFLTHWVMGGLIPVLLLLALVLSPVLLVPPDRRRLAIMWSSAMLAVGMTNLLVMEGFAAVLTTLAIACLICGESRKPQSPPSAPSPDTA